MAVLSNPRAALAAVNAMSVAHSRGSKPIGAVFNGDIAGHECNTLGGSGTTTITRTDCIDGECTTTVVDCPVKCNSTPDGLQWQSNGECSVVSRETRTDMGGLSEVQSTVGP